MPTSCWWPRRRVAWPPLLAAARRAVATIGSGPTGGVSAAAEAAGRAGIGDVVSVDMGGTSYDVCLIRDGRPEIKMDWNWFQRYCIGIPMVDIPSVGCRRWIDHLGRGRHPARRAAVGAEPARAGLLLRAAAPSRR